MQRRDVIAVLVLWLGVALGYAQVWNHQFIAFDDPSYLYGNAQVHKGFSPESMHWAWTTLTNANWHPLTWMSHMLDWQLYGSWAGGHLLTNVGLHMVNAALVFAMFRSLTSADAQSDRNQTFWRCLALAALFAWHPLRVESVAWASERKDVLCAAFGFGAIWAYACYAKHPGFLRYTLVWCLMGLSLLAKPMFVTLPFVLMLLDVWPLGRWTYRGPEVHDKMDVVPGDPADADRRAEARNAGAKARSVYGIKGFAWVFAIEKAPLLALSVASSAMTFYVQQRGGAVRTLDAVDWRTRVANALISYGAYIRKTFVPIDLAAFYPLPDSVSWAKAGIVAAAMAVVSVVTLIDIRRRPSAFVGWWWFVGSMVPVIGLVQLSNQAMADRYTYFPTIGISIVVLWMGTDGKASAPGRRLAGPGPGPWLGGMLWPLAAAGAALAMTYVQVGYWRDTQTLFTRAAAVTERNHLAYTVLAGEAAKRKEFDLAKENIDRAIQFAPNSPRVHQTAGQIALVQGHPDKAIEEFRAALALVPGLATARRDLAQALTRQGRTEEAIVEGKRAVADGPDDDVAWWQLGLMYASTHHEPEAESAYREAIRLNPNGFDYFNALGVLLARQNRLAEAKDFFSRAVAIKPDDKVAKRNLENAEKMMKK